jgi:hypothetical protein
MRPAKLFPLLIGILILYVTFASMGQSASKVQFSILYSNDVMGEVEPCG